MRAFITASFFLLAAAVCTAADLTIVRVWPGYRTDESFEHISEYLGKDENARGQHILRTQPDTRAGYYFLVRVTNTGATIAGAKIELKVITPFSTEPITYNFTGTLPAGSHALNLGLTGTDWPGQPEDEAVAWQLRLLGPDGTEFVKEQSFLWALPEKK